jgi:hypothetical protein
MVINTLAAMDAAQWSFVGLGAMVEAVIIWAWRVSP